jgi:hypothetical protein
MDGMSDCPEGCGWEFDWRKHPRATYAPGETRFPLVWRGWLVIPYGTDPINRAEVQAVATATHLVDCHPEHAEVRRVFA